MKEVARLHGITKAFVSERDSKFTGHFQKGLFEGFVLDLNIINLQLPQIDGQIEMVNQVIEYMLKM